MKLNPVRISSLFVVSTLAACSWGSPGSSQQSNRSPSPHVEPTRSILQLKEVNVLSDSRPSATEGALASQSIQVVARVNQEALLNQEFLYGADLQHSSNFESDMKLYNQSMAIGHVPVHFKIAGDELRLVADNRSLYPSDVNHPEQLMSRFKILSRTTESDGTTTLTISGANSGVALSQIFSKSVQNGQGGSLVVSDSWIRSFEFIPEGNYILQQTSIILSDGTLAEFMESIFPTQTLEPGTKFKKFKMDPADPVGGDSGPVARYRLLAADAIYEQEEQVAYAQHFDISPKADGSPSTIDFYVTPNIPDAYLEAVRNGVEGWNRYFLNFKGIQRAVVQFKGKLPDGIQLGDPRYNVIAWDNRKIAGAAYESQAADPRTGKQSHALIYLPAAWVNIGTDYWKGGKYTDHSTDQLSDFLNTKPRLGKLSRTPRCERTFHEVGDLARSGRFSKDEAKTFGIQILTATLFHEVGHALGAAHNFKGSLNYQPSVPGSIFSTSIMDYNDYELERQAFDSVHTWKGPLLEYDRQIMSTLYNDGQDVAESDPVVPACADAEADKQAGGVDPLCNRYDVGNDPTQSIMIAFARVIRPSIPGDVTLAQALMRLGQEFSDPSLINSLKTVEDFQKYTSDIGDSLKASIQYFFFSGKASITRTISTNLKSLQQFGTGVLPKEYDEAKLRTQTLAGLMEFLRLEALPPEVEKALVMVASTVLPEATKAPALAGLDPTKQGQIIEKLALATLGLVKTFKADPENGLPLARASVLSMLRTRPAPYYLGPLGGGIIDFESAIANALYREVSNPERTSIERLAASKSLSTFKSRSPLTDQIIKTAVVGLQQERDLARSNPDREVAITLLKVFDSSSSGLTLILKR